MKIRKAQKKDLPRIMEIYGKARDFMRKHGNKEQWINGYPSIEIVENDLNNGWLYICEEQEEIAGVFMFYTDCEPTYEKIYEGTWLNDKPYGTFHRIASSGEVKGVSAFCLDWCFRQCQNLRGDTHKNNYIMQKVFEKNGFQKCGTIYVKDGTPRIAYQKERRGWK